MRRTIVLLATMALTLLVASGVALAVNKIGTNGPDTLRGTNGNDTLIGKGDDILLSLRGRDNLLGGPGKDCLLCVTASIKITGGDKILLGGPGIDVVLAGKGSDIAVGAEGNDFMNDDTEREFSKDIFSGGPGNDVIDVMHYRSARGDLVVCGSGFDRVGADRKDVVAPDCEKVVVFKGGPISEYDDVLFNVFYASVPNTFFEGLPPCPMGEERVVRGES